MKALGLKRIALCSSGMTGLIVLCSVSVHPAGQVKQSEPALVSSASALLVSPEAAPLLKRACMDCHSNQTVWPWYSYVAPMSWLVERDVRRGRDRLNFSEWDQYSFKQQENLLADVASAVKNGEMPLRQYTLVHRKARLSGADADTLYGWARGERRRVKRMLGFVPVESANHEAGR